MYLEELSDLLIELISLEHACPEIHSNMIRVWKAFHKLEDVVSKIEAQRKD